MKLICAIILLGDNMKDQTLFIIPDNIKEHVLLSCSDTLENKKIYTITQFIKQYFFDYNEKTIYYLMEKYNVKYDTSALKFTVSLTGTLYAKAEVAAGVKGVAEVSVGAQGTIISITSSSSLTKKSSAYTSSNSISISGGEISVYAKGKLLNKEVFSITKKCSKGWSKKLT